MTPNEDLFGRDDQLKSLVKTVKGVQEISCLKKVQSTSNQACCSVVLRGAGQFMQAPWGS